MWHCLSVLSIGFSSAVQRSVCPSETPMHRQSKYGSTWCSAQTLMHTHDCAVQHSVCPSLQKHPCTRNQNAVQRGVLNKHSCTRTIVRFNVVFVCPSLQKRPCTRNKECGSTRCSEQTLMRTHESAVQRSICPSETPMHTQSKCGSTRCSEQPLMHTRDCAVQRSVCLPNGAPSLQKHPCTRSNTQGKVCSFSAASPATAL